MQCSFGKTFIKKINGRGLQGGMVERYRFLRTTSMPTSFKLVEEVSLKLSDHAKERIELSEKQFEEGKFKTLDKIKKKFLK